MASSPQGIQNALARALMKKKIPKEFDRGMGKGHLWMAVQKAQAVYLKLSLLRELKSSALRPVLVPTHLATAPRVI